jgi:hypothetical protein
LGAANMGSLGEDALLDDQGGVSHKLVRARIQEELAKLEASKTDHHATRESTLHQLAKLEGANDIEHLHTMDMHESREGVKVELSKLQNLQDHDHSQMKLNNEESKERVKQHLAEIEAMHATGAVTDASKDAHEKHSQELEKLHLKQQIFDSKADHEEARKRVMGEMAKLQALHSHDSHQRVAAVKGLNTKSASAAKGLNLKKDAPPVMQKEAPAKRAFGGLKSMLSMKVADEAMAEDMDGAAVNLMQSATVVERKNILKKKKNKHEEL